MCSTNNKNIYNVIIRKIYNNTVLSVISFFFWIYTYYIKLYADVSGNIFLEIESAQYPKR